MYKMIFLFFRIKVLKLFNYFTKRNQMRETRETRLWTRKKVYLGFERIEFGLYIVC